MGVEVVGTIVFLHHAFLCTILATFSKVVGLLSSTYAEL